MEKNQSMVGRSQVEAIGISVELHFFQKAFLDDIGYHLDLILYDFGRFSYLFCLILAIINTIYQGVC